MLDMLAAGIHTGDVFEVQYLDLQPLRQVIQSG
jgi:hypothetical protein